MFVSSVFKNLYVVPCCALFWGESYCGDKRTAKQKSHSRYSSERSQTYACKRLSKKNKQKTMFEWKTVFYYRSNKMERIAHKKETGTTRSRNIHPIAIAFVLILMCTVWTYIAKTRLLVTHMDTHQYQYAKQGAYLNPKMY